MAGAIPLCMAGCNEPLPDYSAYEATRQLNIGAWVGPPSNETTQERYTELAESGLNFIIDIYSGALAQKLEYSEKAGIKYIMNGIGLAMANDYSSIQSYIDHPAFMGIIGRDEPSVPAFAELGKQRELFDAQFPDDLFFVNMLPCYATSDQLGTKYYNDYVRQFNETIKPEVLVYDGYSLLQSATGTTAIESGMLYNLETVAMEAQRTNTPYWAFLQTMGFGGSHRNVTEEDIRFQYYTYMAYGYSGLLHFCYWTPGGAEFPDSVYAMIDRDGKKTPAYYGAQAVNKEVLNFDHVYLSYKWTGTMPVLGKDELLCKAFQRLSNPLTSHRLVESVTATENTLLGTFNDGERDAFMLVNFTDPAHKKVDNVYIKFPKSRKVLVYKNGEPVVVTLKNHTYNAVLAPGEGRFIIPL